MSEWQCDRCGRTQQHPGPGSPCCLRLKQGWCSGWLMDPREQERLARLAAESRRLSLEECVYWLVIAGGNQHYAFECIALLDAKGLRSAARDRLSGASRHRKAFLKAKTIENADFHAWWWRSYATKARLLLEAAKRIREAQR